MNSTPRVWFVQDEEIIKWSTHDTNGPLPVLHVHSANTPPSSLCLTHLHPLTVPTSHRNVCPRRYHMKRCEDSGLWVTGAGGSTSVGEDEDEEDYDLDEEEAAPTATAAGDGTDGSVPASPPSPTGVASGEA